MPQNPKNLGWKIRTFDWQVFFAAQMCPITLIIQTMNSTECLLSVLALGFASADYIYS